MFGLGPPLLYNAAYISKQRRKVATYAYSYSHFPFRMYSSLYTKLFLPFLCCTIFRVVVFCFLCSFIFFHMTDNMMIGCFNENSFSVTFSLDPVSCRHFALCSYRINQTKKRTKMKRND